MMTGTIVTGASFDQYFEHEADYYTQDQTNYDYWFGSLAETLGCKGEISKEQFDVLLKETRAAGKKRVGADLCFSAPKSVSLLMTMDDKTRKELIEAKQRALNRILQKIETEYIGVKKKHGVPPLSHNMICSVFHHDLARPSENNDFVPDVDSHDHCFIHNKTFYDGAWHAVDYKKILDHQKELGLEYRVELAHELRELGYELELTDPRQGFWEISGFDRETIERYSNRHAEVLAYQAEHPDITTPEAVLRSRSKKDKAIKSYFEIAAEVKRDLFESGKIKIKRKGDYHDREDERREKEIYAQRQHQTRYRTDQQSRNPVISGRASSLIRSPGSPGVTGYDPSGRPGAKEFTATSFLSNMPEFDMGSENIRSYVLLSDNEQYNLAKLEAESLRGRYLRRASEIRRGVEIDAIAERAINRLAAEKYAFSVHEAQQRIIAEGVLQRVTAEEAEAAIERAGLIKLGRNEANDKDRNVYITTVKNLLQEQAIKDRVTAGKGQVTAASLTCEQAREALARVEARAKARGETDFSIQGGQQAAAVEHILSCQDRYVAVDGLAGTGKTAMMERLKWICNDFGIEVKGVCFTGKAADGLQNDSGITSTTIHSFLNRLEKESGIEPPEQTANGEIRQEWDFSHVKHIPNDQREIWAVDEAGLVDNNLMYQLQTAAEARGAQVLLLGDPDQLPPVGQGEPLRDMESAGMATARLTDIRRQKDLALREAVRESVRGDHLLTFEALERKGDYREIAKTAERREAVKREMTAESIDSYKDRLLLVGRNSDRKAYNKAIRREYVRRGELEEGRKYTITTRDGEHEVTETRNFATKDRVVFLQNDKKLGVMNGTMATISKIEGNQITVKTDAGEIVTFDITKYNHIDHSYAVTDYKAQGMTVQKVVADMATKGNPTNRNKLYVDISRAKQRAIVYTDDKEKLEQQTRDFARKITGKDFVKRINELRKQDGITNNDRYHAPQRDLQTEFERSLRQIKEHTLSFARMTETAGMRKENTINWNNFNNLPEGEVVKYYRQLDENDINKLTTEQACLLDDRLSKIGYWLDYDHDPKDDTLADKASIYRTAKYEREAVEYEARLDAAADRFEQSKEANHHAKSRDFARVRGLEDDYGLSR